MSTELRPTPETDAAFLKLYAGYLTHPATIDLQAAEKFARTLERQRDEVRERLEQLLDDLKSFDEPPDGSGIVEITKDMLIKWNNARQAAIAAVKGGGK